MAFLRTGLLAVLVIALAGCTGPLTPPGPPTSTVVPQTSDTLAPQTSDTLAPQTATPPTLDPPTSYVPPSEGPTPPYLAVPTLPPGGGDTSPEGLAAGVHCAGASYLANDKAPIPAGVRLKVTSVRIDEGDQFFTIGGSGCGQPLCSDGFAWVDGSEQCDVPLTEKPGWSGNETVRLVMGGEVDCRSASPEVCANYLDKVKGQGRLLEVSFDSTQAVTTSETAAPQETVTATTEATTTTTAAGS